MSKDINRRDFLKLAGVAASASLLAACGKKTGNNTSGGEAMATGEMTYHKPLQLGDDKISLLGYGCMRWPMMKNPEGRGEIVDQEQVNRLVDYAMEHGVNMYDTSPAYCQGQSEAATGEALKKYPRESYYLSTKLSNFSNYSREASIAMYQQSLKDLQTEYLDIYFLHAVGDMRQFRARFVDNGMIDYLKEEREAGRIRRLGFSFHGSAKAFDELMAMHDEVHWDVILIQMNYLDWKQSGVDYVYTEMEKRGIPALIMEPLLGGRLSKLPDHIVARLKQQEPERSVASWAFRFNGSYPGVLSVLSGMQYMEHLQDNIATFSPMVPLTDEEKEFLFETARLISQYPTIPCNDCKYCMPCPYGLDIPAILPHYNKCVNEGNIAESSQDEDYRKARRAFLVGYDRAVPKVRQADRCIDCKECNQHCPQRINIPRELKRICKYIESLKQETL